MGRVTHKRSTPHLSPLNNKHVFTVKPQLEEAVVEAEVFRRSMCSGALRRRVSAPMGRVTHKRSTPHLSPLNNKHVFTVKLIECVSNAPTTPLLLADGK